MPSNDDLIAELNAEIVRQAQEVAHWRKHSDTLAASRHGYAKEAHEQAKVIGFLEDKIIEHWGYHES